MRLSDFKDEKAIEVVAKLLRPVCLIVANPANEKAKGSDKLTFASTMLQNNPKEVMHILAILSDTEPEQYHCTGATAFVGLVEVLSDPEVMQLFGLQSKTEGQACSGARSENTTAHE